MPTSTSPPPALPFPFFGSLFTVVRCLWLALVHGLR